MCLRGSTYSGHGPAVGGALGWVREPRPGTFYLFLGRGQFLLSGFFRHPGTGAEEAGPFEPQPGTHCGVLPVATAQVRHRATKGGTGVSRLPRCGQGLNYLILLVYEKGVTTKDVRAVAVSAHPGEGRGLISQGARAARCVMVLGLNRKRLINRRT